MRGETHRDRYVSVMVLWLAIMLLVLLLFLIRKSFAIISVPAVIALLAS